MKLFRLSLFAGAMLFLFASQPVLESSIRKYSEQEVLAMLFVMRQAGQLVQIDQMPKALDLFLSGLVFEAEGKTKKLDQTARYQATMTFCQWDFFRRDIMLNQFNDWLNLDEETLRAYYEENLSMFTLPERAHFRQIMVENQEEAEAIVQELREGKDFSELAKLYSKDPTAQEGGERGVMPRERIHPRVAEILFSLNPGEFSTQPLQLGAGFYLFQLVEKFPAQTLPFDAAREQITQQLRREKFREFQNTVLPGIIEDLKAKYQVNGDLEKMKELFQKLSAEPALLPALPPTAEPGKFLP